MLIKTFKIKLIAKLQLILPATVGSEIVTIFHKKFFIISFNDSN